MASRLVQVLLDEDARRCMECNLFTPKEDLWNGLCDWCNDRRELEDTREEPMRDA